MATRSPEPSEGSSATVAAGVSVDSVNAFLPVAFPSGSLARCVALGPGWATVGANAEHLALRPGGIVSGPTVFALCDAALYVACFTVLGIEPMTVTSEMSIRFVRPAFGTTLLARADLVTVTGRNLVGTVRAWTDDEHRPVAVAQGAYARPRTG